MPPTSSPAAPPSATVAAAAAPAPAPAPDARADGPADAGPRLRVAATSDLHYAKDSRGKAEALFAEASRSADVLLLGGDLTDYGLAEEAHVLAADIRTHVRLPVLAVLGNHDFESDQTREVREILAAVGVRILDGESVEIQGVGFAGVCGFGGGFGARMLNAWGEPLIKQFVHEAVNQAMRLEQALSRLQTRRRVALLHYSPLQATVEGEPPEIFPFLGSSRLEGPLNRHEVSVAFHGHAHRGQPQAQTTTGVPVYNVAVPVLQRLDPGRPAFRVVAV